MHFHNIIRSIFNLYVNPLFRLFLSVKYLPNLTILLLLLLKEHHEEKRGLRPHHGEIASHNLGRY